MKSLNIQHIILLISALTIIATIIVLKIVFFFGRVCYTAEVFSESNKPLQNPYCGFYHIIGYTLSDIYDKCDNCTDQINKYTDQLVLLEINLKNYRTTDISENGLANLNDILAKWAQSQNGTKLILRFLYDWDGIALATELTNDLSKNKPNCDVIICTPFIHLASIANVINKEVMSLGAENCADKEKGAYTGEVSASMVRSTGADYVILGHSERRAYYNETPEILKEKVNLALQNNLKVIFCIGEVLEEREAGKQNEVVGAQLEGSLFDLTKEQFSNIILAYEPVWAIGTGKTATAEQAEEMHAFIRKTIENKFGAEAAENVSILYGGSCKPSNAREIFSKPDVDGGLIGGAALKAADFEAIIDAWK